MSKSKKRKHLQKSLIPKSSTTSTQNTQYLNKKIAFSEGWIKDGNNATALVSLRLVQDDFQCFSVWTRGDMRNFWEFQRKVHDQSWQQILSSGGKNNKTGLGYTPIPKSKYPSKNFIDTLSPDTSFFELRVSQKSRVHGFRSGPIFYICWLDRNHDICP